METTGKLKLDPLWPGPLVDHQSWLSKVIFARLRNQDAVDEVLQETALAASKGTCPTESQSCSRWLYRVALRQAILYRRKLARQDTKHSNYADQQTATSPQCESSNPLAILLASEQAELVHLALRKLNKADCEILLLKYTEEWSCQEIADRLGGSRSAIKSRLLRARKNLRQELMNTSDHWKNHE